MLLLDPGPVLVLTEMETDVLFPKASEVLTQTGPDRTSFRIRTNPTRLTMKTRGWFWFELETRISASRTSWTHWSSCRTSEKEALYLEPEPGERISVVPVRLRWTQNLESGIRTGGFRIYKVQR